MAAGGQVGITYEVGNYPGFESISGPDLSNVFLKHAEAAGLQMVYATVQHLKQEKSNFIVETTIGEYKAKKVIIATGGKARKLEVPNERNFLGHGVSYCASCDGNFYKNKIVAVVGGGNSAMKDVQYLTHIARKVYLINRSERFRANPQELEKVKSLKNVEIITSATIQQLNGTEHLTSIKIKQQDKFRTLKTEAVFIAIGFEADLDFLDVDIERDDAGYIIVNEEMQTSMKNLYACGDITSKKFKQIITACADGAIAGNSCI